MALKLSQAILLLLLLSAVVRATPNIAQSLVVNFPINGRVIVQAREEVGKFPQMLFMSEKTGKVLLQSSIEDEDEWLIPDKERKVNPGLRFRTIRSSGLRSPIIMAVGLDYGGSDNHYFLTVFGEVDGKIFRLNDKPFVASVQGGYYWGYLNKRFGYGLAVWNFIWGNGVGESHYSQHKYEIEIYRLEGNKLKRTLRRVTSKMYDWDKGAVSLREIGVRATDQRRGIPVIKDSVE